MPSSVNHRKVSFDSHRIIQMVMSYRSAKILLVATDLDIFTSIRRRQATANQISTKLKIDPRAARILLDSLVSLGFLKKTRNTYANTSISGHVLIKGKPNYIGNNLKYQELVWEAWSD